MPPGGGYTPPPAPPGGGDYPPQYPYPAGGYGGAPQSNQKALWSMILGIASLVTCFCCAVFPLGLGGAAIFLGRSAKAEIEASGGMQTGAGQAQAGFVLGIVGVALGAVALVLTIILFASGDGSFTTYNDF